MTVHLRANHWKVLTTSEKLPRIPKMLDMMRTAWRWRDQYALAHIECYSGWAFGWAEAVALVLKRCHRPFILTLHSGNFPRFAQRWRRRVRRLFGQAVVVTTPSGYLQEHMKAYRDDLLLIPNALEVSHYAYRERFQIGPRLIWLRGFLDYYNPCMAPRVVAHLSREFPDLHLSMVGPDKGDGSWQQTKQLVEELKVTKQVSFPGGVKKSEVPGWLDRHDIFINTTNRDNTPISVMEAMASGLNVVSTNVDGIPYLVDDGKDGLLVKANDDVTMAAAVRRLLTEPGLGQALARRARAKVQTFDWSVVLPQWEQLYRQWMPHRTHLEQTTASAVP
jgi:glycosyltransferase involved in cell wall biosynthesis